MQVLQREFVFDDLPPPHKPTLASEFPDLAAEWDFDKNGLLRPEHVTIKSAKKVWWKCKNCRLSWQARVYTRTAGHGCPYDAGQLPIPGKTDLATLRPDIAAEWDYEKNGNLTPEQVTVHSTVKVWWKCPNCEQSWYARIYSRSDGSGCPYDAGKLPIPGKTDLATLRPDIAAEWDYAKNGNLTPEQVTVHSGITVWWKCSNCAQSWMSKISSRVYGKKCPYDSGKLPIPGKTDLETLRPDIAAEWDYEKNRGLTPNQICGSSRKKYWWKCLNCGRNWQASALSRTNGLGCPYDAGRLPIPGKTDLVTLFPDIAAEWDYEKNGDLYPEQVTGYSNKKVWWRCRNCGQSWCAYINNRVRGNRCPYDAGKLPIPGKTDLATLFPDIAAEWDYEKNGELEPKQFLPFSHKKVWWRCLNCNQRWEATISHRTRGKGCPYDAGKLPILGKTDLLSLHPEIAAEWDYDRNLNLKPEMVTEMSGKKVWWKCKKCGQSWQTAISARVKGSGCPFDAGRRPIPGKTDLATLFPGIAAEWDYEKNMGLLPNNVATASHRKVWWRCKNCGLSWCATISSRVNGKGCPFDAGKLPIPGKTDLVTLYPALISEWDYEKNGKLGPDSIAPKSNKKKWWICKECGTSWMASTNSRTRGSGCPHCKKNRKPQKIEG